MRQVAGGGRAVEVPPERLAGWFDRFAGRHGGGVRETRWSPPELTVVAVDGARAVLRPGFGGLPIAGGRWPGLAIEPLCSHVTASRRVGLVLVRLGGYSVGVARDGVVTASRTGSRQVHGRAKAGGSSAPRFARRREGQARQALRAAADAVADVLLPVSGELDAVVLGGDSVALAELRADKRLTALLARAEPRVLDVPEPRRRVLDDAAVMARAVEITVLDPPP